MADEVSRNRKRRSNEANIHSTEDGKVKKSNAIPFEKQTEDLFLTPDGKTSYRGSADVVNDGTVRRILNFEPFRRRPALPGTPCQFEQISPCYITRNIESMDTSGNTSSQFFAFEKGSKSSPDSGITYTASNIQESPNIAQSSGIGSLQAMEEDTLLMNSQTSEEIHSIEIQLQTERTSNSKEPLRMQTFFQRKFVFLKKELIPSGIADRLYNDQVITEQDVEAVREAINRRTKCDVLIKAITRSLRNDDGSIVQKIKDAIVKEGYIYVLDDYEEYSRSARKAQPDQLSSSWKSKLKAVQAKMEDELDPCCFIDQLVSEEVLNLDEHQNIMTVSFKPEKVTCLIKYLLRKTEQTFVEFSKVLKKAYPQSSFVGKLCSSQPLNVNEKEKHEDHHDAHPKGFLVRKENQGCQRKSSATAHIKFKFKGDANDIEKMIVDENSPVTNVGLLEEAMDIGSYDIVETTFSSIRIVLSALSNSSEMQIVKKCKQSPVFLMKLLQSLIKPEYLKKLQERKINSVFFEIKVEIPGGTRISKMDIVRNKDHLCKELTKNDILQILRDIEVPDQMEIIKDMDKAETNTLCIKKFIGLVDSEESDVYVDSFLEYLKKHNRGGLLSKLTRTRSCSCKISKENVVEHYTLIEKELTDVDKILEIFSECSNFDKDVQDEFKAISKDSHQEQKVDSFLRHLLQLPDDGLQLCLLEKCLHTTGQDELLQNITKIILKKKGFQITEEDIRRNKLYLCDELEPKQYLEMIKELGESGDVCEKVIEAASREYRCEVMIDFIMKSCQKGQKPHTLSKFSQSLQKWNPDALQYIIKTRKADQKEQDRPVKENIIASYKHIIEEIEPLSLLAFFKEREELTEDEVTCVKRSQSRRARAVTFANFVLKGSESKASCLMDALQYVGYVSLLKKIQDCMQQYRECQRLYAFDCKECFSLEGELDINFNDDQSREVQEVQLSTNRHIFNNWSLVTKWIFENHLTENTKTEEEHIEEKCRSVANSPNLTEENLKMQINIHSTSDKPEEKTHLNAISSVSSKSGCESPLVRFPSVDHSSFLTTDPSFESYRLDEIYSRTSCSSSSNTTSRLSRATSIEDDNNESSGKNRWS